MGEIRSETKALAKRSDMKQARQIHASFAAVERIERIIMLQGRAPRGNFRDTFSEIKKFLLRTISKVLNLTR